MTTLRTQCRFPHLSILWRLLLLLVLLAGAAGLACSGTDSRADEGSGGSAEPAGAAVPASEEEAVPVEVEVVRRGPIESYLRFSTNLEAESEVGVYSQAARQVRELRVEEGDEVAEGEVLVRLQDDEQRTELAKVESQLARARREHERQQRLFAEELISEQAMNDSTYELDQLELAHEEARRQLSYAEVRAPIAGTVTRRLVNLGDTVTLNQHLFDLVDFDSIVARVFVPEKELGRLAVGLRARVRSPALGVAPHPGRVARIAPVVDPKSGTVKVTVALPRDPDLRPGMYVDVELVTAVEERALLVPKRALVYDDEQIFIFRVGEGERVEKVLLRPLIEDERFIEPEAGVEEGERVVVAGQTGLKDGTRVRLAGGTG